MASSRLTMRFNVSILTHIRALPEPHRSNIFHSFQGMRIENITMPSIFSALCMIRLDNGFCPEQYYLDLYNALIEGKITLAYGKNVLHQ